MNKFKYYNVNINLIIHDLQLLRTSISWFNVPTYKPNAHHQKFVQLRDRCSSKMRDAVWIFSYSGVVWVHDPQPHHLDHAFAGKIRRGRCILKRFLWNIFIDYIIVFFPDLEKALPVNFDNWLQSHQSKYGIVSHFHYDFSNFQEPPKLFDSEIIKQIIIHPFNTRDQHLSTSRLTCYLVTSTYNLVMTPKGPWVSVTVHRNSRPNLRF